MKDHDLFGWTDKGDRLNKAVQIFIGAMAALVIGAMLAAFAFPPKAHAEGSVVSDACTLRWQAPTTGGPVEGYRVYVGTTAATKTRRADVPGTSVACGALSPAITAGQQYVHVTAYNVVGESGASTSTPFVVVTTAPGVPTAVQVLP